MGARERPAADSRVLGHRGRVHRLDDRGALAVPQLADVEVALDAVDAGRAQPAEHDVAGGLHQPLALDDSLSVVGELAVAEERLEHRALGLLALQEQRVAVVVAEHQHDPRARADAADAHHLARRVHVAEALEQAAAVAGQRAPVGADQLPHRVLEHDALVRGDQLLDRHDQRRVADDPRMAVDEVGQPVERPHAVLRTRLGDVAIEALALLGGRLRGPLPGHVLDVDARIPERERPASRRTRASPRDMTARPRARPLRAAWRRIRDRGRRPRSSPRAA